jgi:CRP/FNR family cyclic AMP-dependent transcriptional regulator
MPKDVNPDDLTLLSRVLLFSGLTEDELLNLLSHAAIRRYRRRTLLMEKGDSADVVYVILQGMVRIYAQGEDDKEITLNELSAGQYFGELALIDAAPRSASAVVLEDARLLVLPRAEFMTFLSACPDAALRVIHDLVGQVRSLTRDVERLALRDVYGRLVDVLGERARDEDGRLITDAITQQELANLIGASREMVSRILKDLRCGGYISLDGKRIELHQRLPEHW